MSLTARIAESSKDDLMIARTRAQALYGLAPEGLRL
jgi:hypothetical protein